MIRLLVADDMEIMRKVIQQIVDRAEDVAIVSEETNLDGVVQRLDTREYDVILLNDFLPHASSDEGSRKLRDLGIQTPILVMGVFEEAEHLEQVLAGGANGIVFKKEFLQELLPAIRAVAAGQNYLSPLTKAILAEPGGS